MSVALSGCTEKEQYPLVTYCGFHSCPSYSVSLAQAQELAGKGATSVWGTCGPYRYTSSGDGYTSTSLYFDLRGVVVAVETTSDVQPSRTRYGQRQDCESVRVGGFSQFDGFIERARPQRSAELDRAPKAPPNEPAVARDNRKGAEWGDSDSQYRLATLYYDGQVVPLNDAQAAYWFEKAGEQGHAEALFYRGEMYYQGRGGPRDFEKAASWYREAAARGSAIAQADLATMSYDGQGVSKDLVEAYKWITLAVAHAATDYEKKFSSEVRDVMTSALPRETKAEGESRARDWTTARQHNDDLVRETALRWMSTRSGKAAFLIQVDGGLPSPLLMSRFKRDSKFRSFAEVKWSPGAGGGLKYVLNGAVISVDSLMWRTDREATVHVGSYVGPLEGWRGRIVVERGASGVWSCREVPGTWSIS
ncbi:MAG: tetratricopeptide repeat protein [Vicinamibacteria bacterium]